MLHVIQLISSILTISSGIMTVISFFSRSGESNVSVNKSDPLKVRFVAFLVKQRVKLLIATFVFLISTLLVLIPEEFPDGCGPTPIPAPTVTPSDPDTVTPLPHTPTPLPTYGLKKKLTELTPIVTDEEAFRINAWDDFNKLCVGDIVYDCGIGIRIPPKDQRNDCEDKNRQNADHKEYIEYSLSFQYTQLECELGVDTSTYENANRTTPSGRCKVVFQDAKSDEYLAEEESVLYDTDWFNYRLIKVHIPLDVSQVGTLRITVYWEYNPDYTKQNCFNLAIIDPVLYLKEA